MNFALDDDRQMLADMLRRFLAEKYPIEVRNAAAYGPLGYDPGIWNELVDLGILGALFSPEVGGFAGAGADIALIFEELGRALVVEPFLSLLMAGTALTGGGHPVGARVVANGLIAAFAHDEGDGPFGQIATAAITSDDGWLLNGRKAVVSHAEAAGILVVSAQTSAGISLFALEPSTPGVSVRGYGNIDGGRSADVTFQDVRLMPDALIGRDGAAASLIEAALDAGILALSAEALGAMESAKLSTIDYLRTRVQFGLPIGKFQALQHRMANVLLEIEQARSAVINAAGAFDGPPSPSRDRIMSAAKYTVGQTGTLVAEEAVQLHGGIGMTWELPLSHQAKRIVMIDHQLGDQDVHLARYMARTAHR